MFGSTGQLVSGQGNLKDLAEYKRRYMNSDYATQVHNLYFINSTETNTGNRFVAFVKIQRDNDFLGTIVIELNQQRIESGKAFPKLLMDAKYVSNYIERDFDFAIFDEDVLSYSSGIFSYHGRYRFSICCLPDFHPSFCSGFPFVNRSESVEIQLCNQTSIVPEFCFFLSHVGH